MPLTAWQSLAVSALPYGLTQQRLQPRVPIHNPRLPPRRQPVAALSSLGDFKAYREFDARWSNELSQFKSLSSGRGDTRFYYTGMAQAVLLDRFMPAWKARAMPGDAMLEDLLAEAVN